MHVTHDILIVDDDVATVEFMTEALSEEGYAVRSTSNGAQALSEVTTSLPALVLLDLHLQGLSGRELLEHLHRNGNSPVPVVVMTADYRAAQQLTVEGAIACLLKPFNLDDLFNLVARYLPPQCSAQE
jgi:CheY-like chemotaxis protein